MIDDNTSIIPDILWDPCTTLLDALTICMVVRIQDFILSVNVSPMILVRYAEAATVAAQSTGSHNIHMDITERLSGVFWGSMQHSFRGRLTVKFHKVYPCYLLESIHHRTLLRERRPPPCPFVLPIEYRRLHLHWDRA